MSDLRFSLMVVLGLAGCLGDVERDVDGDGYTWDVDCDDNDPEILPWDGDGDGIDEGCGWRAVSVGHGNACGVRIRTDASLECWATSVAPPSGTFESVSAGDDRNCGVTSSGSLECWGGNEDEAWPTPL